MSHEEVLSQDEIDVLLDNAEAVAAKNKGAEPGAPFELYDIYQPQAHAEREEMPDLSSLMEYLTKDLAKRLETLVNYEVTVTIDDPPSLVEATEFIQSLDSPSAIAVVGLQGFDDPLALVFDPSAIRSFVSALFGGDGSVTRIADEFTPTEWRIAGRALDTAAQSLPMTIPGATAATVQRHLSNPASLNLGSANDLVAFLPFSLTIGNGAGRLLLVIMQNSFGHFHQSDGLVVVADSDSDWHNRLTHNTTAANIHLSARVAEFELAIGDLLRLARGDFIPADIDRNVLLCADQEPLLKGILGISGTMNAVHIIGPYDHNEATHSSPTLAFNPQQDSKA